MTDDDFVQQLWHKSDEQLLAELDRHRPGGAGDFERAEAVLRLKALAQSRRTARWTMWMAIGTGALALATFALVIIAAMGSSCSL